jgi:tRNA(Ile)-lysidine synthase
VLIQRIRKIILKHSLAQPGNSLVIGTSGGVDSTALLHLLHRLDLGFELIAVYIDHGLRPAETAGEIDHLQKLTASLDIRFLNRAIDVFGYHRATGCSIEEAARHLRYQALEEIRRNYNAEAIAVGHTADDQVEELYIRLIRGSGLKGLGGMEFRAGRIIRPLLAESKQILANYLADLDITTCHDSSNDDRRFLRNKVRLDLLPWLAAEFNPAIRQTTLQTMAILREEEDFLAGLCQTAFADLISVEPATGPKIVPKRIFLQQQQFVNLHTAMQRRILERICLRMLSKPSFRQIEALRQIISRSDNGAEIHLDSGLRVRKQADIIIFTHPLGRRAIRGSITPPLLVERILPQPGWYTINELAKTLTISCVSIEGKGGVADNSLYCDADLVAFPLQLRPPRPGEKMQPFGAPGRKKVLRIMNDLKIPVSQRHLYPVLSEGERIVAIVGLKIADNYRIGPDTTRILVLQWHNDDEGPAQP